MSASEVEKVSSLEELKSILINAGIDLSLWGVGGAKSVKDFYREIVGGETNLFYDEEGNLVRHITIVGCHIYYELPSRKILKLVEKKQVFPDGRERFRDYGHAVSEKIKPGEDPEEAMLRGIKEELDILINSKIDIIGHEEETRFSPSYPGVLSKYSKYGFNAYLDASQFRPEGYVEVQPHITTYFEWEET